MASGTSLLNTRTVNFLELIGNGKVYRVPPYQRDYSWEEEQWEDLWSDIESLLGDPTGRHYMGALVVEGRSDREFLIIDGQQRFATLSLLALAVLQILGQLAAKGAEPADNLERIAALRARFLGEKDPASLVESSKLFLNETDDAFYQDYLVQLRQPLNRRGLPHSNRQLWDCFQYFLGRLQSHPILASSGRALAELLNETVARQLLFILIVVDDDMNAYTVFETLNARGLELSSTDLLKNYLFSRVRVKTDLVALQRRWQKVVATVRQERFPEFLRYHLLTEHPKIRQQRLFKLVREKVATDRDAFDLLMVLERRAEIFAAVGDSAHEYWLENPAARGYVRELQLLKVRQITPLLFAGFERLAPADFARLVKLVAVISFRYSVIGGLNTNELEPAYHRASKALLEGRIHSVAQVFGELRSIYVEDEKFIQDFSEKSIDTRGTQQRRLAKYILCRLETHLTGKECDFESDPATIEHILPENADPTWDEEFPLDRRDSWVYRLGNLTLLELGLNREVGNAAFPVKSATYLKSRYRLSQDLASNAPEVWSLEALQARQRRMARLATQIWRSDFA